MTGPPKEVKGRTPHHQGRPSTNTTSSHHTADTDSVSQHRRRRIAAQRLPGGDPWPWCYEPLGERGYPETAAYLADQGLVAAPNRAALQAMWKRGGHHRQLAEVIAERWGLVAA